MRRKKGKIPFGFREIKEGSKDLEEIPEEIAALEDIKDLIDEGAISLRDGAAWIGFKTGRKISHQGLKNVIKERYQA